MLQPYRRAVEPVFKRMKFVVSKLRHIQLARFSLTFVNVVVRSALRDWKFEVRQKVRRSRGINRLILLFRRLKKNSMLIGFSAWVQFYCLDRTFHHRLRRAKLVRSQNKAAKRLRGCQVYWACKTIVAFSTRMRATQMQRDLGSLRLVRLWAGVEVMLTRRSEMSFAFRKLQRW